MLVLEALFSVKRNASHKELSSAFENHFPKLKVAGGFEVLCAEGIEGDYLKANLVQVESSLHYIHN